MGRVKWLRVGLVSILMEVNDDQTGKATKRMGDREMKKAIIITVLLVLLLVFAGPVLASQVNEVGVSGYGYSYGGR